MSNRVVVLIWAAALTAGLLLGRAWWLWETREQ